jgi:hypothetical protein
MKKGIARTAIAGTILLSLVSLAAIAIYAAAPEYANCPRDNERARKIDEVLTADPRCPKGSIEATYTHVYYGHPPEIEEHTFTVVSCIQ